MPFINKKTKTKNISDKKITNQKTKTKTKNSKNPSPNDIIKKILSLIEKIKQLLKEIK